MNRQRAELRRYLGAEVQGLLPESAALEECRLAVSIASIQHQTAVAQSVRLADPTTNEIPETVKDAFLKLTKAQSELNAFPARPLAPFEIPEYLNVALSSVRRFLLISSRTIDRSVVTPSFLLKLENILEKGVDVVILLGEKAGTDGPALDLERLRMRFSKLELISGRRQQFYHLVCDEDFALVSNKPILGNAGKVRTLNHVVGYILQRKNLVQAFIASKVGTKSREPLAALPQRASGDDH